MCIMSQLIYTTMPGVQMTRIPNIDKSFENIFNTYFQFNYILKNRVRLINSLYSPVYQPAVAGATRVATPRGPAHVAHHELLRKRDFDSDVTPDNNASPVVTTLFCFQKWLKSIRLPSMSTTGKLKWQWEGHIARNWRPIEQKGSRMEATYGLAQRGTSTHKMDNRWGFRKPLETSRVHPVHLEMIGGGLCTAVDVYSLKWWDYRQNCPITFYTDATMSYWHNQCTTPAKCAVVDMLG